jgi:ribulose-phosphate 3-epimerase
MTANSLVVPAILTDDKDELVTMARKVETFAPFVQVDIMDGRFVPSRSIHPRELVDLDLKIPFEIHLMVEEPQAYLEDCSRAGAQKVIFHYEATREPSKVITQVKGLGMMVGLAVNPETPLSDFLPLAEEVDGVLFLSVNPGFYGKPFIPEVLDKLAELRKAVPGLRTGIDGGIKEGNIAEVAETGVDDICVGSAIMKQPDPAESWHYLQSLIK